jgi:single-strand DNA-binding protein
MNRVELIGRITADIEIKNTASQVAYCSFNIAVDRKYKDQNGQRQADFITCVAWRKTAELIGQSFRKGHRIAIMGSLQTRTYDDRNGNKRYATEVLVEDFDFIEHKSSEKKTAPQNITIDDAEAEAEAIMADLPFEI